MEGCLLNILRSDFGHSVQAVMILDCESHSLHG